ncbi:MAG: site-specific integrase, partial [Nitrospira sp.]|nr:site-specific integrase [Nitrospira sp.]
TEDSRIRAKVRLEKIVALIRSSAFFPCKEFPDSKIADFCQCPNCAVVEPLSRSHKAPKTLGELFAHYKIHEANRASGDNKIIESTSWGTKLGCMRALEKEPEWFEGDEICSLTPLTDYKIQDLSPEWVRDWLVRFQHRLELTEKGNPPATTRYMNNILSAIRGALKYGRFKRWWRSHPLLDHEGALVEATKLERSKKLNKTLNKPFTLLERDRILSHLHDWWLQCDEGAYNGKEKPRRLFIYHYVVIGFNTGLRSPSEMTALEWGDIDYARRTISVRKSREASGRIDEQIVRSYTKTIKHREVPINDAVMKSLRALEEHRQEGADWVFWNPRADNKNPFRISNGWAPLTGEKRIRYPFERCLKKLQIPSPTHSGQYRMRHTFTTLVLDNTDMTDAKVAALIGDAVETMKANYQGHCRNRWRAEDDVEQLNALNSFAPGQLREVK